jgi:hypothetical protein
VLFVIQFSISVAALSIGNSQQDSLAQSGWCALPDSTKIDIQNDGGCFGFLDLTPSDYWANISITPACMVPGSKCPPGAFPFVLLLLCTQHFFLLAAISVSYSRAGCYSPGWPNCPNTNNVTCTSCYSMLSNSIAVNMRRGGGVSLAFAFTEVLVA